MTCGHVHRPTLLRSRSAPDVLRLRSPQVLAIVYARGGGKRKRDYYPDWTRSGERVGSASWVGAVVARMRAGKSRCSASRETITARSQIAPARYPARMSLG